MRTGARIETGLDTGMSGNVICAADSVMIGNECLLGADVIIADNDSYRQKPECRRYNNNSHDVSVGPILIGDNVFIGVRSKILTGICIGLNSAIGVGSVMVSNIQARVFAASNPVHVVRELI